MKEIIPTVKIINHVGVSSIKDGMKGNDYSLIERENKPKWIKVVPNGLKLSRNDKIKVVSKR